MTTGASIAPQTFLQLATSLQVLSGTSGSAQPTVAGATGEWQRMCKWISDAYLELQMERQDWEWMQADATFNTVIGQQAYSPFSTSPFAVQFTTTIGGVSSTQTGIPDFRSWLINNADNDCSFRLWLTSAGVKNETYLDAQLNYKQFRDNYIFGARRLTNARPISIVEDPSKSLLLGLTPNDDYTVTGKYFQMPIVLAVDTDTPAMPAQHQPLIVYRALEKYAIYEAAPEVLDQARRGIVVYKSALDDEQLSDMQFPDPLA